MIKLTHAWRRCHCMVALAKGIPPQLTCHTVVHSYGTHLRSYLPPGGNFRFLASSLRRRHESKCCQWEQQLNKLNLQVFGGYDLLHIVFPNQQVVCESNDVVHIMLGKEAMGGEKTWNMNQLMPSQPQVTYSKHLFTSQY